MLTYPQKCYKSLCWGTPDKGITKLLKCPLSGSQKHERGNRVCGSASSALTRSSPCVRLYSGISEPGSCSERTLNVLECGKCEEKNKEATPFPNLWSPPLLLLCPGLNSAFGRENSSLGTASCKPCGVAARVSGCLAAVGLRVFPRAERAADKEKDCLSTPKL